MTNDPILKCLLIEVGRAIGEVEYTAPRHEIVRVLDDASRKIAELGIREKKAMPVTPVVARNPKRITRKVRKLLQPQELLVVLYESNQGNRSLSVRDWLDLNKHFFDDYYHSVASPVSSLSSVMSQLVGNGMLSRKDIGNKYRTVPTYRFTLEGIKEVASLQKDKHLMSEAYKRHFGGKQNALGI
jgi:hypothetical protein